MNDTVDPDPCVPAACGRSPEHADLRHPNPARGEVVSTTMNRRDLLKVRAYRVATTATMMMMLAQSLGAGKKWG